MSKRVTLSFDNGPVPGWTERVLDTLARKGIKSSFFVIGRNLENRAAQNLAEQARREGHWLGNHTMTHTIALGDEPDADYAKFEIGRAQELLGELVNEAKLFRPFGNNGLLGPHLLSKAALEYLLAHHYATIAWNSVPGDWKDAAGWVERGVRQVMANDWSVVVLHDIVDACAVRLVEFIDRLNDLDVTWEQAFPTEVILTRGGQVVSLPPGYVTAL